MKRTILMLACIAAAGCSGPPAEPRSESKAVEPTAEASAQLWVTTQYADRHTCPSTACGVVGRLFFREGATPLETRDGWVRVSKRYDAACENGRSAYVDKGEAACTTRNGIEDGRFAEWVLANQLSKNRPPDPAGTATADESLVADSDDFTQHRKAFAKAAQKLIAEGRCAPDDFREIGGWLKSSNHRDQPVYFTYCGGMTAANRIYLDAVSGRIF